TRQLAEVGLENHFDEQLFFMNLPKGVLAPQYLTREMLDIIAKQAYVYDIPANEMALLVVQATQNQQLDLEHLRKDAKNYYRMQKPATKVQFATQVQPGTLRHSVSEPAQAQTPKEKLIAMFETTAPLNFLSNRLGRNPNQYEREMLEKLLVEYKLQPGVVNVLIDYSLRNTDNQFRDTYIEKVAASWSTQQLLTVSDAMAQAKKNAQAKTKAKATKASRKKTQPTTRTETLPDWTQPESALSADEAADELQRIKELMKDLK
ncbi:MAG: DnaD domain protein, partial [Shewanella sp.]